MEHLKDNQHLINEPNKTSSTTKDIKKYLKENLDPKIVRDNIIKRTIDHWLRKIIVLLIQL